MTAIEAVPVAEHLVCRHCAHPAGQHSITRTSHRATLFCNTCEREEMTVERSFAPPRSPEATRMLAESFRVILRMVTP